MKNPSSNGFSLVELLLAIVIIGILAALATAGFMASRRSANEGSAIASMRILHSAQMTYSTSLGGGEFIGSVGAGSVTTLNALNQANLIDDVLGSGAKSGYNIVGGREPATATTPAQFFFSAIPVSANSVAGTGSRRFGVATDGVLKADTATTSQYPDATAVVAAPAYDN